MEFFFLPQDWETFLFTVDVIAKDDSSFLIFINRHKIERLAKDHQG